MLVQLEKNDMHCQKRRKQGGKGTMEQKINELSKKSLQKIVLEMSTLLTDEQYLKLEEIIADYGIAKQENTPSDPGISQELVDSKMQQFQSGMKEIDEGKLYLHTEEYEDYSSSYYDRDWITEYYDNQGIGEIIYFAVRFAKQCVENYLYQEANDIYEWLWAMSVSTDGEFDNECVDLETLVSNDIINIDMEQLALLTLYADYQVQEPDNRAEDIYLYFSFYPFQELHIQDMFHVGRETLCGTEQFWKDWIALLVTKQGDVEARLLREAVYYTEGVEGLLNMADKNCKTHPSLYLVTMKEYDKNHDYAQIERIGEQALTKIDSSLKIRSQIALEAANASSSLGHTDKVMVFCWECFKSDSTYKNYLRLFGMQKMAELYGKRGREVLDTRIRGNQVEYLINKEMWQNRIDDYGYYILSFYTGDFQTAKGASENPKGSLGWSARFIQYGIPLFLLYLYEDDLPSKAAASLADDIGFRDNMDMSSTMDFENEIIEESHRYKVSIFWSYFQRWKRYFPIERAEQKRYLTWAEKTVYERADAIVGGQHRNKYREVAVLLEMIGEIKESEGEPKAKQEIFAEYKRKFPRHLSFQSEMKSYFNLR